MDVSVNADADWWGVGARVRVCAHALPALCQRSPHPRVRTGVFPTSMRVCVRLWRVRVILGSIQRDLRLVVDTQGQMRALLCECWCEHEP